MSDPSPALHPPDAQRSAWSMIWVKALTRPSVTTFSQIANDATARRARAYAWVFVTGGVGYLLSLGIQVALGLERSSLELILGGPPIAGAVSVIGFAVFTILAHMIARTLGGSGSYDQLAFALAAYIAPLTLITSIASAVPPLSWLTVPLGLFGIGQSLTAIKATHRFSWSKAIVSSAAILGLVCIAVVLVIALALF